MKAFFSRFVFRPKDLKDNVEREGKVHKAKVICFSVAMGAMAAGYQSFFDNLTYRSAQMQGMALAGKKDYEFRNFRDFNDPDNGLWNYKNQLDVLDELDLK